MDFDGVLIAKTARNHHHTITGGVRARESWPAICRRRAPPYPLRAPRRLGSALRARFGGGARVAEMSPDWTGTRLPENSTAGGRQ